MRDKNHPLDQLHFQIGLLMNLYRRIASNMGLSESAFWILYVLSNSKKALSQSEVAELLSVPKQTINSSMKFLKQYELVSLYYMPDTTRTKIVKLTDRGRQAIQKTIAPLRQTEERILREAAEKGENWKEIIAGLCTALNEFTESSVYADIFHSVV